MKVQEMRAKDLDLTAVRERVQAVAAKLPGITLVYLFGSRAKSGASIGPMSDYDFGVLFDRSTETGQPAAALGSEIAKSLGDSRVDIVVLNDAPIELAFAVVSGGNVIFARTTAERIDYEAYVMGMYGDYLPVLRAQRQQILEGGDRDKRTQRYRETLRRTRRAT